MTPSLTTPEDTLAASVFALGLTLGFVRREDIVRWADRRITEIDQPPMWLIDISLSQDCHLLDLISTLKKVGQGVDPDSVFRMVLAMAPDVRVVSFDEAEALAERTYEIARDCVGDCHNELLREISFLDASFDLVRNGYVTMTRQEAIDQLAAFVEEHRDKQMLDVLRPTVWTWFDASG